MLNAHNQNEYMAIAMEQPNILCSDMPPTLLEAASWDGEEPSPFFVEFLSAGYQEWLAGETGQRVRLPREILDQIVWDSGVVPATSTPAASSTSPTPIGTSSSSPTKASSEFVAIVPVHIGPPVNSGESG